MMFNKKENKKGLFKKMWYSIAKIDKYGEMSAEGIRKAISYALKLSVLVSVIIGMVMVFKAREYKHKGIQFIEEQIEEFSYKNGILDVANGKSVETTSSMFGEIIINTQLEDKQQINELINSFEEGKGVLLLKDKIILKGIASNGAISYKYTDMLQDLEINETNKEQLIEVLYSREFWRIYAIIFAVIAVYAIINISITILFNAAILSIFGYLATWIAKIKMRFAAIFNLAIYSLTLSTILQVAYLLINMLTSFTVTYFQLMYIAIAAVYLIAAIFMIKADFLKTQIVKMSKENNDDEITDEEKKEEDKDKNKDKDKKEEKTPDNKEEKKDSDEPEGSQA